MNIEDVARAAGVSSTDIRVWRSMKVMRVKRGNPPGKPVVLDQGDVLQAKALKRARLMGLSLTMIGKHVRRLPQAVPAGSILAIRFKDSGTADSTVANWTEIDPSDGEAIVIIALD